MLVHLLSTRSGGPPPRERCDGQRNLVHRWNCNFISHAHISTLLTFTNPVVLPPPPPVHSLQVASHCSDPCSIHTHLRWSDLLLLSIVINRSTLAASQSKQTPYYSPEFQNSPLPLDSCELVRVSITLELLFPPYPATPTVQLIDHIFICSSVMTPDRVSREQSAECRLGEKLGRALGVITPILSRCACIVLGELLYRSCQRACPLSP